MLYIKKKKLYFVTLCLCCNPSAWIILCPQICLFLVLSFSLCASHLVWGLSLHAGVVTVSLGLHFETRFLSEIFILSLELNFFFLFFFFFASCVAPVIAASSYSYEEALKEEGILFNPYKLYSFSIFFFKFKYYYFLDIIFFFFL